MSNIYNVEPPTKGKVLLRTNYGDIDIELWAREAPLACRNFVQLGMEGYYDGLLFHRVIKDFMIQGGDPTGTLRFNHRGLVAMANENRPNTNQSQFFITLDSCEDLKGKHTIFGKVTGNTIFNVLRMGDVMTDESDRPLEAIKMESMEILSNPFDDIIPRDLSQMKKRRAAVQAEDDEEKKKQEKKKQRLARVAKKDLKLLSFGDDAEDLEQAAAKSGPLKSSHDVLKDDPTLRAQVDETVMESLREEEEEAEGGKRGGSKAKSLSAVKKTVAAVTEGGGGGGDKAGGFNLEGDDDAAEFAARMRKKLMEKKKKSGGGGRSSEGGAHPVADLEALEAEARKEEQEKRLKEKREEFRKMKEELKSLRKAAVVETGDAARKRLEEKGLQEMLTPLELRRKKFLERKKMGTDREDDTLSKLGKFTSGLWAKKKEAKVEGEGEGEGEKQGGESYHGQVMEDNETEDAGPDWFVGKLKFKKHIDDDYRIGGDGRKVDDYVVIDPKDRNGGGGGGGDRDRGGRGRGGGGDDGRGRGHGGGDRRDRR